jgi:hypothetical protein
MNAEEAGGHNVPDRRIGRRFALKDDFPGVIPFGYDAHHPVLVNHDQRSHAFLGHEFEGIEHPGLGGDGPHAVSFGLEDLTDGDHEALLLFIVYTIFDSGEDDDLASSIIEFLRIYEYTKKA